MLMVNKFGNVYMEVATEREKKKLEELGYKVVEEPKAEEKAKTPKKKTSKGVKKNDE